MTHGNLYGRCKTRNRFCVFLNSVYLEYDPLRSKYLAITKIQACSCVDGTLFVYQEHFLEERCLL
jgi:hypothetical protein